MSDLPERFNDEDLNEKQRELLSLLSEYDEPDTPLVEIEDQTPWSRKTCKKWLDRLEGRSLVRSRQLPGQETWMYSIADPRSAYGVPGDLDLPPPSESDEQLSASWGEKVLVAGAAVFVAAMAAAALVAAARDFNLLPPGFVRAIQAWIGLAYIASLAGIAHGTWTTVKERGGWSRYFQKFSG